MGRGKPKTAAEKAKKPKTTPLPKTTGSVPKRKKDVLPKPEPKSQNPAFTKWTAYSSER
jgi:hypothetical protein